MTLQQISDSLWLAEGGMVSFYGFPYPTRAVVVRLDGGALWVWSPIALSPDLGEAIDRLGPVRHLVSPNKIHHLFLQDWAARYPEAALWGPRSTIAKRPDLTFRDALTDIAPPEWRSEIDQAWFRGSVFMDEVVFFHRPSRTVIMADLVENFSDAFLDRHWSWWQRLAARLDGITQANPGAPREWRWSFLNRRPARAARDRVLDWRCDTVIMAHGEWQRAGGHAFLKRSLAWLGD